MVRVAVLLTVASLLLVPPASAKTDGNTDDGPTDLASKYFSETVSKSAGAVSVEGRRIDYQAFAGALIVHPKGWDDAAKPSDAKDKAKSDEDEKNPTAEASMFYVAYFKRGANAETRPVTFLFNGGPGSSTVWLHMGAFGPRRIVTRNDSHTPPAPYRFINNDYSLLDASDLVFIDAPGTGFSRIRGKDKDKSFYAVDPDAYAFASFISQFLSKYGRWNSPKYIFGESYGTFRAPIITNQLETERDADINGVILLSTILSYDLGDDYPQANPGVDYPYVVALPSYAATAWYHHLLPGNPPDLDSVLASAEKFAQTDYATALSLGAALPPQQREAVAEKLHDLTGLPVDYILKANLRINGPEFDQTLQGKDDLTTGRLDSRFSGPAMDPLSEGAQYDPQAADISSAYVSVFNDYVRKDLHYGDGMTYIPESGPINEGWVMKHQPPGAGSESQVAPNVMPDLAYAMKYDPDLKVMVNGGYFDLATPHFEGIYEMHHLPIEKALQSNIEYHYYLSGHMVYANEDSLKQIHDDVAAFIRRTEGVKEHQGDVRHAR